MIRIGIVGIGQIAEDYISIFSQEGIVGAKLTALTSRNEERVRRLINQHDLQGINYYKTLEEMLRGELVDGVIITTPHTLHEEMATLIIKQGKHVLVDKPLGITALEVDRLAALEDNHPELTLGVLFNRRSNDLYQRVKDITTNKELGDLRRANWQITNLYRTYAYYEESSWRGSYETEGGGVLMNQAIHQLDLLVWFTGMPRSVMAHMKKGFHRPMTTENDVALNLFYDNGATGQFLASTHESPGTNRLELSFTKGQIIVEDDSYLKITSLCEDEKTFAKKEKQCFTHVPCGIQEETLPLTPNKEEQKRTIQNFINSIKGEEKPLCDFKQGKNTVRLVNASYLSSWLEKKIDLDFDAEAYEEELARVIQN